MLQRELNSSLLQHLLSSEYSNSLVILFEGRYKSLCHCEEAVRDLEQKYKAEIPIDKELSSHLEKALTSELKQEIFNRKLEIEKQHLYNEKTT